LAAPAADRSARRLPQQLHGSLPLRRREHRRHAGAARAVVAASVDRHDASAGAADPRAQLRRRRPTHRREATSEPACPR
jgi:hypothetical protein